MGWSIVVYESLGRYVLFSMADLTLYDMMKETSSSEDGIQRYGLRFVAGKRDIPDIHIDTAVNLVSKIVNRMNQGERLDLERELALVS